MKLNTGYLFIEKNVKLYFMIAFAFLFFIFQSFFIIFDCVCISLFTFLFVLFLLLYYIKNIPIFLFLFFSLFYLYVPRYFFVDGFLVSAWGFYQYDSLFNLVSYLNFLFFLGFFLGLRKINDSVLYNKKIIGYFSDRYYLNFSLLFFLLILILVFGLDGEVSLISATYGDGTIKSPIYEYFIAVFLLALLFLNSKSKLQLVLIIAVYLVYSLKTFLYGGRIEVVQLSILFLMIFTNFYQKYRLFLLFLLFFFFLFLNFIGVIRENPFALQDAFNLDFEFMFENKSDERGYVASQYGDVFQSSLRIVGLIQDGYIDIYNRVESFLSNIFGVLIPRFISPESSDLATFGRNYAMSGGGGLISAHSYAWLSFFGPVIFGYFIGFMIRFWYASSNIFVNIYVVMLLATFPRWFAYNPVILFKLCLFNLLLIALYVFISRKSNVGKKNSI